MVEVGRRLVGWTTIAFGVLLAHCSDEYVAVAAAKIVAVLHGAPIVIARGLVSATASIGAASFGDHGSTSHELITCAEAALADAKRTGRNRYVRTPRARITASASAIARRRIEAVQSALWQGSARPRVPAGRLGGHPCG